VAAAFDRSPVRRLQETKGNEWSWSICALPLRRGHDLLLGLNWGRDPKGHRAQYEPPADAAIVAIRKDPTERFARVADALLRHYGGCDLSEMNYFNVCPFRSRKIDELELGDRRVAIEHFFLPAIDAIAPPRTLILGKSAVDWLLALGRVVGRPLLSDYEWRRMPDGGPSAGWGKGVIVGGSGRHRFIVLPHPQARIKGNARDRLCSEAFGEYGRLKAVER